MIPMVKRIIKKVIKALLPAGVLALIRKYYLEKRREKLRKKLLEKKLTKRKILDFEVHLADHCNLNCKGCFHFCPIADEKYPSVQSLENDFKRIYELANGKIGRIYLLGGEPLLHPELIKIINVAGKYFSQTNLQIVTNGILLSKQSEIFWKACRSNNVKIVITKYPIRLPFNEIEKTAKKHGVKLTYFGQSRIVRHSKIGLKTLWKLPLNLQGTEDKKKSFELCHASNTCILLEEGKIYTCAPIPYIKYFNKHFGTNVEVSPNDYINIYEVKNIEEVFEFLCKPMPFCRYCNRREPVYGIDWDTSKKEISEWV